MLLLLFLADELKSSAAFLPGSGPDIPWAIISGEVIHEQPQPPGAAPRYKFIRASSIEN